MESQVLAENKACPKVRPKVPPMLAMREMFVHIRYSILTTLYGTWCRTPADEMCDSKVYSKDSLY